MAGPSIFISYASQDREAARAIRDVLSETGFEVWYDENELGGGDAWDRKIRGQIRECTYFMPVVSSSTEARLEGYFRREWRLAVERTLDMADDVTFLVPVVLGSIPQNKARVPEKFLAVQWLSLPESKPTPAFGAWARRLIQGDVQPPVADKPAKHAPPRIARTDQPVPMPPFPEQQPGRNLHFIFLVIGWAPRAAWAWYRGLRRGWRRLILVVIVILCFDRACSSNVNVNLRKPEQTPSALSTDDPKVKAALEMASQIAKRFGDDNHASPELLVYPFVTPAGDAATQQLVNGIFTAVYRRCTLALPKKVGMAPSGEVEDPLQLAREREADKMLTGDLHGDADHRTLEIKLTDVDSGKVIYTGNYALAGADGNAIATDLAAHLKDEAP